MEPSSTPLSVNSVSASHKYTHDNYIKDAKMGTSQDGESDSDEALTLHSDRTEININKEDIVKFQKKIIKSLNRRIDMSLLERPGICSIFPREEYKFEQAPEYVEEEKRQHNLWRLAHKVFKIQRKVQKNPKLTADYEDKYIKFKQLKPDELHKYTHLDEDEYLKQQQKKKSAYKLLSNDGEGLTYKMWKTNARLVRSILDLHGFQQIGGFECSILWTNTVGKRHMFQDLNDYQWINHFPSSFEITRKMDLFKNFKVMQSKFKKKEYHYCPDTFLLPDESVEFRQHLEKLKQSDEYDPDKLWIVKPNKLSRGRGIYLIKEFDQLDSKEPGVVSEYVDNPL